MAKKTRLMKEVATTREKIVITKEEVGTVEGEIGPILTSDPKIHFSKYASKNSVPESTIASMRVRNPRELKTEKEWEEQIKKENSRKIR